MRAHTNEIDPNLDYVARRNMTINGQSYPRGAVVPRSLMERRKYDSWVDNRILVKPMPADAVEAAETPIVPKAMKEAGWVTADPEPVMVDGLPADSENGYLIETGRGWYNVHFGKSTLKVRTFEAASDRLRELRGTQKRAEPTEPTEPAVNARFATRANGQSGDMPPVSNPDLLDDPREPDATDSGDDESFDPDTGELLQGGAR